MRKMIDAYVLDIACLTAHCGVGFTCFLYFAERNVVYNIMG